MLLAGALMGGLCAWQYATKTYDSNYGGFAQVEENPGFFTGEGGQGQRQRRLAGPLGSQNRFAQILLMLIPLGLTRFWTEPQRAMRLAAVGATLLISLGLLLTFSRGAAVGALIILGVMIFMRLVSGRQLMAIVAGVGILLLLMPQYLTRLASLGAVAGAQRSEGTLAAADGSLRSRAAEALAAVYMIADHPWTGVGPGMYPHHFQKYGERVGTDVAGVKLKEELRQPHVLYLGVAAELGLPGLLVLLAILFAALLRLERARRASLLAGKPELALLAMGFLLALVGYMGTGLFLHLSYVRYFWLIVALASAAAAVVERELSADQPLGAPEEAASHGL
jgi:O-antigen ligase